MATTVTYKGETLATVRNATKTLKTGGTWVEGDIGITDETSTAVVAVEDVPDSHGGIEKRITAIDISDTDATASDVAQGKVFYSNTGTRTTGTGKMAGLMTDLIANTPMETFDDDTIETIGILWQNNTALKTLVLRALKTVTSSNTFAWNRKLETCVLPALEGLTPYDGWRGCGKMTVVDLGTGVTRVDNWTFESCKVLTTIVLRPTSVCALVGTSAFGDTPYKEGGTGGEIFVPSALIDSYKSATNWSTVHGWGTITWKAIEGSQYENYYADGSEVTA